LATAFADIWIVSGSTMRIKKRRFVEVAVALLLFIVLFDFVMLAPRRKLARLLSGDRTVQLVSVVFFWPEAKIVIENQSDLDWMADRIRSAKPEGYVMGKSGGVVVETQLWFSRFENTRVEIFVSDKWSGIVISPDAYCLFFDDPTYSWIEFPGQIPEALKDAFSRGFDAHRNSLPSHR
jgi:hypothetical protein